jgi:Zn-dependent oligopeptidase
MNSSSRASGLPMLDWPSLIKESLSFPLSLLPQSRNFEQPILPGWEFGTITNITTQNSSAPETERAIVASQSYGRQLGRMMDVLDLLIARVPEKERQEKAFEAFGELREEIDDIKTKAATRRLDRIAADLTALKQTKPVEYRRVVAELRELLKGG